MVVPGVTEYVPPLAVVVSNVPPVAAVYQFMVLPAEIALSEDEDPAQIVAGVAVAAGALGVALIVTVALP